MLATTGPHRDVPHAPAGSPVPLAVLAEISGLVDVVVVEVTELGLRAAAVWAWEYLVWLLQGRFLRNACFALLVVLRHFRRRRFIVNRRRFRVPTCF